MKFLNSIPGLPVKSIGDAMTFYTEKLGFETIAEEPSYGVIKRDDVEIHLWVANNKNWMWKNILLFIKPVKIGSESFLAGTQSCRFRLDDVQPLFDEVKDLDILHKSSREILDTAWGTREFSILDLCGNLLTFYQDVNQDDL